MEIGKNKVTYIVTFTCHHVRIFPEPAPKRDDVLWCPQCNRDVRVVSAPAEYRIRCQTCIYSDRFGTARINAELAAVRHRSKKPGHVVYLFDGHTKLREFGNRDQDVIPMSSNSDQNIPF